MSILIKNIFKNYWFAISSFILFEIFLVLFFIINKNEKIEIYLTSLQQTYMIQFETISKGYSDLAQNTFFGIINKPKLIDPIKNSIGKDSATQKHYRDILYKEFLPDYERLKQFQFQQIQFHLPNNRSFLRMHKPNFSDDDLSSIRIGVVKTNNILKPVTGFEIGKTVYGFRHIFPIFDENLFHIGSVELTVPVSNYVYNFEKVFQLDAHFILNKKLLGDKIDEDVVKSHKISSESKEFFVSQGSLNGEKIFDDPQLFSFEESQKIQNKIDNKESFIFSKKIKHNYYTVSFINVPCIDESNKCAYLVLYKESPYIEQTYANFEKILVILLIALFIFLFVIYKNYLIHTKNIQRQEILSQQTKLASMGEMIGNIAHQWRQPLSVISAAASGMKVQQEYGLLKEEKLIENLDMIFNNTQYLSQTIEDFRNFFKTEKEKTFFELQETITLVSDIFIQSFKADNVDIIINGATIQIYSYQNEFKQVIINLLKNAKDAIGKNGLILIDIAQENKQITISVQDSGGGVDKEIQGKIFDPYFTTKHQSQGTGLGLYMTHEIIKNDFNGILTVENNGFEYNFKHYYGARFIVSFEQTQL